MSIPFSDQDFCLQKVDSAIGLVERLIDGDYPHPDAKIALRKILDVYKEDRNILTSLSAASQPTLLEHCRRINMNIVRLKPFLGMILKSSNLRNAFEIYFPIKLLAQQLLKAEACIILSSEWNFSPFTYPAALKELPEFVFIGVPASECQNPLIVPLSAHELGHVIWNRNGVKQNFEKTVRDEVLDCYKKDWDEFCKRFLLKSIPVDRLENDMFVRRVWNRSYQLALRQIEEIFCDFVALNVFGRSFLLAFRYLLAPSLGFLRSPLYPKIAQRADYLRAEAQNLNISDASIFPAVFSDQNQSMSASDVFILDVADNVTKSLVKHLSDLVKANIGDAPIYQHDSEEENDARLAMTELVPPLKVTSPATLINAAWSIRLDIDNWPILKDVTDLDQRRREKLRVLRDLTLKGLEVFEYQKRLEKHAIKQQ